MTKKIIITDTEKFYNSFDINSCYTISFINPYSYLILRNKNVLDQLDYLAFDSIIFTLIYNLFTKSKIERSSFDNTTFGKQTLTKFKNKKILFIGSEPNIITKSVKNITTYYGIKNFRYTHGYHNNNNEIIDIILNFKPNLIVIGMGTPLQEYQALALKNYISNGLITTCGGYLTQASNKVKYYPFWIERLHIRWLYRFINEKHVFIRTVKNYPFGIYYFIKDLFLNNLAR